MTNKILEICPNLLNHVPHKICDDILVVADVDDSGGEELQIKKKYFVAKTVGKLKKKNSLAKTDTGAYKIPCFYQYSQMTKEQKEIEFHWPVMKVKAVGRFHELFFTYFQKKHNDKCFRH